MPRIEDVRRMKNLRESLVAKYPLMRARLDNLYNKMLRRGALQAINREKQRQKECLEIIDRLLQLG